MMTLSDYAALSTDDHEDNAWISHARAKQVLREHGLEWVDYAPERVSNPADLVSVRHLARWLGY